MLVKNCLEKKIRQGNLVLGENEIINTENPKNIWYILQFLKNNLFYKTVKEAQLLDIYITKLLEYRKFQALKDFLFENQDYFQKCETQILNVFEMSLNKDCGIEDVEGYLEKLLELLEICGCRDKRLRKYKSIYKLSK